MWDLASGQESFSFRCPSVRNVSSASCGQELSINYRHGPVECVAAEGSYHLTASFRIAVTQGKGVFNRKAPVADFDPAPQLDAFWSDILKPFRAVPRRDFGFQVILRVVEDAALDLLPTQNPRQTNDRPGNRRPR
ncbi:MAG TPA: hypothetical protein VGY66_32275 [Gemmataceae bacterium]|jgi:hypothetical protein|nr:hypothetical protein [Gemmataceae bacterium]